MSKAEVRGKLMLKRSDCKSGPKGGKKSEKKAVKPAKNGHGGASSGKAKGIYVYMMKNILMYVRNKREENGVRAARNGRGETSSGKVTYRRGKNEKIN